MSIWSEVRHFTAERDRLLDELADCLTAVEQLAYEIDPAGVSVNRAKQLLAEASEIMTKLQANDYYLDTRSQLADLIDRCNSADRPQ